MNNHIYLIGPMGVGKTTVGRRLACELMLEFFDCDQIIESKNGVSIATIFDIEGDQGFRYRETAVLKEISSLSRCVVSTGGGVVLKKENVEIMRQHGIIIYLQASFRLLWNRLKNCKTRPLLQTESPQKTVLEMLEVRDPLYHQAAHQIINVDTGSVTKTIGRIKQIL